MRNATPLRRPAGRLRSWTYAATGGRGAGPARRRLRRAGGRACERSATTAWPRRAAPPRASGPSTRWPRWCCTSTARCCTTAPRSACCATSSPHRSARLMARAVQVTLRRRLAPRRWRLFWLRGPGLRRRPAAGRLSSAAPRRRPSRPGWRFLDEQSACPRRSATKAFAIVDPGRRRAAAVLPAGARAQDGQEPRAPRRPQRRRSAPGSAADGGHRGARRPAWSPSAPPGSTGVEPGPMELRVHGDGRPRGQRVLPGLALSGCCSRGSRAWSCDRGSRP